MIMTFKSNFTLPFQLILLSYHPLSQLPPLTTLSPFTTHLLTTHSPHNSPLHNPPPPPHNPPPHNSPPHNPLPLTTHPFTTPPPLTTHLLTTHPFTTPSPSQLTPLTTHPLSRTFCVASSTFHFPQLSTSTSARFHFPNFKTSTFFPHFFLFFTTFSSFYFYLQLFQHFFFQPNSLSFLPLFTFVFSSRRLSNNLLRSGKISDCPTSTTTFVSMETNVTKATNTLEIATTTSWNQ